MNKKYIFILLLITIISCNTYKKFFPRNDCDSIRILSRNHYKLNLVEKDFYKICDTASIYKYIGEYSRNASNQLIFINYNYQTFYKFYSEGKAGKFHLSNDNFTKEMLNPCLAINSYYGTDNKNRLILKNYFISKVNGDYLNSYILDFKGDTLTVTNLRDREFVEFFIKTEIPKNWLTYKPDW